MMFFFGRLPGRWVGAILPLRGCRIHNLPKETVVKQKHHGSKAFNAGARSRLYMLTYQQTNLKQKTYINGTYSNSKLQQKYIYINYCNLKIIQHIICIERHRIASSMYLTQMPITLTCINVSCQIIIFPLLGGKSVVVLEVAMKFDQMYTPKRHVVNPSKDHLQHLIDLLRHGANVLPAPHGRRVATSCHFQHHHPWAQKSMVKLKISWLWLRVVLYQQEDLVDGKVPKLMSLWNFHNDT